MLYLGYEKAILGGAEIADSEGIMGYGPARYLEYAQVKAVAAALGRYPIERKASNFDPRAAAAKKIYSPHHSPEELAHYFNLLKNFYHGAASEKHAMLLWLE